MKFPIGTIYSPVRGKLPSYDCTVTDYWVTRNLAGEIVKSCYVTTHIFCGQVVKDFDVCETTIARGTPRLPEV